MTDLFPNLIIGECSRRRGAHRTISNFKFPHIASFSVRFIRNSAITFVLLFISDGDVSISVEYDGQPFYEHMIDFLRKRMRPAVYDALESDAEIEAFKRLVMN